MIVTEAATPCPPPVLRDTMWWGMWQLWQLWRSSTMQRDNVTGDNCRVSELGLGFYLLLKMGLIRARKLKYLEYDGDNRLNQPPRAGHHHNITAGILIMFSFVPTLSQLLQTLNQTWNLLDFFSSSSSRPRSRRDIADTLGTVLLSQIFSLINLKIFLSAKIFSLTNPSIIVQTLRDDEGLYFI